MKLYAGIALILFIFMLLFPLVAMRGQRQPSEQESNQVIDVLMSESGRVETLDMQEYIVGVVASEMPPTYHEQALMAQAVASYTYALNVMKNDSADGADITDSPASHQGYAGEEELRLKWGDRYDRYIEKIRKAVAGVSGQRLTYDGEPIKAAYHALNTGSTLSAADAWGGKDIVYLTSVESIGDTLSPNYSSVSAFTAEQFKQAAKALDGVSLDGEPDEWIGEIETSDSGAVKKIVIGGKALTGSQVRTAFSLKSAAFVLGHKDGVFTFTVYGYGHMVGMSQYGADYMARQGSDYREILLHYYPGARLND